MYFFQGMFGLLKVLENFQKKIFSRVPLWQFELSILPPIATGKTDLSGDVSCKCSKNV